MVPSSLAGLEIYCGDCGDRVVDHRAHIAEALHDAFEVQTSNGTRVSVGDLGASQEIADQEAAAQAAAKLVSEKHLREWTEEAASSLAAARDSLASAKQTILGLASEIISLNQTIRAMDREQPRLEKSVKDAEQAIETARCEARVEVATWALEKIYIHGATFTDREQVDARDYLEVTHHLVMRAYQDAGEPQQALRAATQKRETLARQLLDAVAHKAMLEESLPGRQEWVETHNRRVAWTDEERIRQLQVSLLPPLESLGVPGLALRRAKVKKAIQEAIARFGT